VEHHLLELPVEIKPQDKSASDASQQSSSKNTSGDAISDSILCLTFSLCGNWLASCSSSKHLVVWRTSDWIIISNRTMPRAASSVIFTPSGSHIIVADKSGDAFLYSALNWEEEGLLCLGHLSMLLDVITSADGKYVITCDRDEKIRVSHLPNAYNIASYCLGHEEFVTSLALLPHDVSILVSCSGDGSLCLWDFVNGSLCKTYSCISDITANLSKVEGREDTQNGIPLMKVSCFKLDASTSVACIIPDSYHGCLIYRISSADSNFNNVNVNISLMQAIPLKAEPCAISFSGDGTLLVLTLGEGHPLLAYTFDEDRNMFSSEKCSADLLKSLTTINSYQNFFIPHSGVPTTVSQLFKRKFDNVQVYQERKKARMCSNTSSAAL